MDEIALDGQRSVLSLGEVRLCDARRRQLMQEVTALVQRFGSDVDPDGTLVTLFVAAYEEQP